MPNYFASSLKRLSGLASLADQVLVSGGNFLTIAICAHTLTLTEQGKFTYVFASYMALLLLNIAGVFQGAAVRAPTLGNTYQITLARLQVIQAAALSLILCSAWCGGGAAFGWKATADELALLFAFLLVQQLADFDRRSAYIFAYPKRVIFSSALLYPCRIIGLILVQPDTVNQVLVVLIISALIPALFTVYKAIQSRSADLATWLSSTKAHLSYSKLFILGAPLGWLWAYIPIFMLGMIHGKEQAALLAGIRGISNMANVLMEQIETKVVADWARVNHLGGAKIIKIVVPRLLRIGFVFWLIGMLFVATFGREIVVLVLGNLYGSHWKLLIVSWIAYGLYFYARVIGIKRRALGENQLEFYGNLIGVVAAVVAGLLIIPVLGVVGAAWSYAIIAISMLVGQHLVNCRTCKQ